ncbi:MAG: hypothetical protein PW844_06910 [Pantoea sp.]|uniref:hypothetical protein n=1 Tax=Pantoea sp. TaxID=69393 RepID=UPI00238E2C1A|nr:hypothetical protein [Pantoea sp.]MDE1186194.1 hypothetical protein [Pantoea sp.]
MKNHRKDAGNLNDLTALLSDENRAEIRERKNGFKNNLERDIAASSKIKSGKKVPPIVERQPQ